MDKRQITLFFCAMFLVTLFSGCWSSTNRQKDQKKMVDPFYTETGGWDMIRVPLIKPYEAIKVDPKDGISSWTVDFKNSLGTYNVRKVDVQDSIIYILSGRISESDDVKINTLVNVTNVPIGWYIIDVEKSKESSFSSEFAFNKYIKENKYRRPNWRSIDSLIDVLSKGSNVPWMPK